MAYTKDDPRSALTATKPPGGPAAGDGVAAPQFLDFSVLPPDVRTPAGSAQWIPRGQNFVLVYTEPVAGDVVWRSALSTETVLLLIDEHSAISGTSSTNGSAPHDVTG